jgi:hypothetical protein
MLQTVPFGAPPPSSGAGNNAVWGGITSFSLSMLSLFFFGTGIDENGEYITVPAYVYLGTALGVLSLGIAIYSLASRQKLTGLAIAGLIIGVLAALGGAGFIWDEACITTEFL